MIAEGPLATIEIGGEAVILRRKRLPGSSAEVISIRFDDVTGVEFKDISSLDNGHIKINQVGATDRARLRDFDRSTVVFTREQREPFVKLYNELIRRTTNEPAALLDEDAGPPPPSIAGTVAGIVLALVMIWFWYTVLYQ